MGFIFNGVRYVSDFLGDADGNETGLFITDIPNGYLISRYPMVSSADYPAWRASEETVEKKLLTLKGVPEWKVVMCQKQVFGKTIKYPCGTQKRKGEHMLIARLTCPADMHEELKKRMAMCLRVAGAAALKSLAVLLRTAPASLGAAIPAAAAAACLAGEAALLSCAKASIGFEAIKGAVKFDIMHKHEHGEWRQSEEDEAGIEDETGSVDVSAEVDER